MKKNLFFAMVAGAMLVGCSDDATSPDSTLPEDNGSVEVIFNSINVGATVDPLSRALVPDNGWVGSEIISLVGLAKGSDSDWTSSESVLFKDATNGCIDATVNKGAVTLGDTYYYPFDSKKSFSFYACYPKATIVKTADKVTVNYNGVTGQTDILAGSAVSKYEDGYNAKYYRQHIKEGVAIKDLHPTISLEHKLTRLDFKILKGENDEGTEDLKVKSLVIKNVPTNLVLTLADKNSAKSSLEMASNPNKKDITVFSSSNVNDMIVPSKDKKEAGAVALYPSDFYEISMVLVDPKNESHDGDIIKLYTPSNTPFVAGARYEVTLKIYGMRPVVVDKIEVKDWVAGDKIEEEVN